MNRPNYRRLVEKGEIKTFTDLIKVFRKEMIETYQSQKEWPTYKVTAEDERDLRRIYSALQIDREVPFAVFAHIFNSRNSSPI